MPPSRATRQPTDPPRATCGAVTWTGIGRSIAWGRCAKLGVCVCAPGLRQGDGTVSVVGGEARREHDAHLDDVPVRGLREKKKTRTFCITSPSPDLLTPAMLGAKYVSYTR